MKLFYSILKFDYLQRTRTYAFFITLCATLAIAYSFVPEPNAIYSTIRIDNYVGYYNSAWFGYVTAIMTTVFLSLIGFFLVNSSVQMDQDTNTGQIIATTSLSNFKYLLAKAIGNFLILSTITLLVFLMSIILFFLYNSGYSFSIFKFIKPYAYITFPALFCISVLAVLFEVFMKGNNVLKTIVFFIIFSSVMFSYPKAQSQNASDIFGINIVLQKMEQQVREITNKETDANVSIGYIIKNDQKPLKFEFNGLHFSSYFIISRILWMIFMVGILWLFAPYFHRFRVQGFKKKNKDQIVVAPASSTNNISVLELPIPEINFSQLPLVKTEFLMILRMGNKGLWFLQLLGMALMILLPLSTAYRIILPLLWFIQVGRLSNLGAKEYTNSMHYFSNMAYKPIRRLLLSKIIAGNALLVLTALPLMIRLFIVKDGLALLSILLGSLFLVLIALTFGIIFRGRKLFEVLFFMLTYANINGIVFTDYFGALPHQKGYLIKLTVIVIALFITCFAKRSYDLSK